LITSRLFVTAYQFLKKISRRIIEFQLEYCIEEENQKPLFQEERV